MTYTPWHHTDDCAVGGDFNMEYIDYKSAMSIFSNML